MGKITEKHTKTKLINFLTITIKLKIMRFLTLFFIVFYSLSNAQEKLSEPSKFIERSSYVQINMDETEKASFKSGLGESVEFYPCQIIDLKSTNKMNGMQVESRFIIGQQGMSTISARETAWIGLEEIADLIVWFENYVIPNLNDSAGKKKTVKYIFNCKELMLKFEIMNRTQIFSVIMNNTDFPSKYFWTESQVDNIPNVVKSLKYLQTKN